MKLVIQESPTESSETGRPISSQYFCRIITAYEFKIKPHFKLYVCSLGALWLWTVHLNSIKGISSVQGETKLLILPILQNFYQENKKQQCLRMWVGLLLRDLDCALIKVSGGCVHFLVYLTPHVFLCQSITSLDWGLSFILRYWANLLRSSKAPSLLSLPHIVNCVIFR